MNASEPENNFSEQPKYLTHSYLTRLASVRNLSPLKHSLKESPLIDLTAQKPFISNHFESIIQFSTNNTCVTTSESFTQISEFDNIKSVNKMRTNETIRCRGNQSQQCIKIFQIFMFTGLLGIFLKHFFDVYINSNLYFTELKKDISAIKIKTEEISNNIQELSNYQDTLEIKLNEIAHNLPKLIETNIKLRNDITEQLMEHLKKVFNIVLHMQQGFDQYNADKTGRTDFALESAGGVIMTVRNTESYTPGEPSLSLFGISLCSPSKTPNAIIQASTLPGECWAFKGSIGTAVIKLIEHIQVTGISLEHIPTSISPTGDISTAPKDFSIWGLKCVDDLNGFFFGQFTYELNKKPIQYFSVKHKNIQKFNLIEFKVLSNHGNPHYTCTYRIRIHGNATS